MKYFGEDIGEKHKELSKIIRKSNEIAYTKKLFLEIHASLHTHKVSNAKQNEVDILLEDLKDEEYAIMPTSKDETIAWVLWHIARIEDLTLGCLVSGGEQIFNIEWKSRMNATITDTGNALTDDEIIYLSKELNKKELLCYRNEVGKRTREIVSHLTGDDMKRKVSSQSIEKILLEGGVTNQTDSIWLLDFWGKKDVAGVLLMPPTRHMMLHLNDCCKWKEHIRAKKKLYKV